jgi:CubicO group peptidase (beta-lactamase class C family)
MRTAVLCVLLAMPFGVAAKQPSAAAQHPAVVRADRIAAFVDAARNEEHFPAISVVITRHGRIIYDRAFGVANLESGTPASTATQYRIASVAKPITATAILQLVASGRVRLTDSIRKYIPELSRTYTRVTIRDLLRHTSGVRHYKDNAEFISTVHCSRLDQALRIFASDPLEHAPGEKITYSSWGYVLLGIAVERASGTSYFDYIQRHILSPAGMRHTRLDRTVAVAPQAVGYTTLKNGKVAPAPVLDSSCRIPAGGIISTAEDIARFAIALQDGRILERSYVRQMESSQVTKAIIERTLSGMQVPPGFKPPGMGYGFATEIIDGEKRVYHGGNQPGATAMLYIVPDRSESVVILTNLDGQGEVLADLARKIVAQLP